MGKFIDLTGKTFGKLKVIKLGKEYLSPKGERKYRWECVCKCGNKTLVTTGNLTKKKSGIRSCGCSKVENLAGLVFGRLKVVERSKDHIQPNGTIVVTWRCVCQNDKNIVFVSSSNLKRGKTVSCGCYQKEMISLLGKSRGEDLKGKRFGLLLVLEKVIEKRKRYQWVCKCNCGNIISVFSKYLKNGDTKSCGCISESCLASELKKYCLSNYGAITEHKCFKNPETNQWLPYDIYLPNKNVFIEVHGEQHYILSRWHRLKSKKQGTSPEEEFEYQKKKDRMKRKFARKNGTYIEINLRKIKTTEEAIEYIENIINKLKEKNYGTT